MTCPVLAWLPALKMTNVKLELLTDPGMNLFLEEGMRGRISVISHKHAKANNAYAAGYNPELPKSYIAYLDANILFG